LKLPNSHIYPSGITVDRESRIWLSLGKKIYYRNPLELAFTETKISKLIQPGYLAVDETYLYITDQGAKKIWIYDRKEALNNQPHSAGQIKCDDVPIGIFVDSKKHIYLSDCSNNFYIYEFNRQSCPPRKSWGTYGFIFVKSNCNKPRGIMILKNRMFVVDSQNKRIVIFK